MSNDSAIKIGFVSVLLSAFWTLACANGWSQDQSSADDIAELEAKFSQMKEEFRGIVKEGQKIRIDYFNAPSVEASEKYIDLYEENKAKGDAYLQKWIALGLKLYDLKSQAKNNIDDLDLRTFVTKAITHKFDLEQYQQAYELAKRILADDPSNPSAKIFFVRSALLTNHFGKDVSDRIPEIAEHLEEEGLFSDNELMMIRSVYYLDQEFEKEKAIREKEAKANDLPRVEFETPKGNFVIELFENEAPETVGNFISLVESRHFDGLIFDAVASKTVVQSGILDDQFRPREIGYRIFGESEKPGARKIFTGTVAMYSNEKDDGGSVFFIALSSLVQLHGKQTAFGRVISGMDVLYDLTETFEIKDEKQVGIDDSIPDKIISARVLRKRDHEYKPRKVPN